MVDPVNRTTNTADARIGMHMGDSVSRIVANAGTQTTKHRNVAIDEPINKTSYHQREVQSAPTGMRPTTGPSILLQSDEHDYVQNALSKVYPSHTSQTSPLRRTTKGALK